jgi:hypothetical protein
VPSEIARLVAPCAVSVPCVGHAAILGFGCTASLERSS